MLFEKSLFIASITPINNQIIAPYLFAKKLILDEIGKKQVKMMLKTKVVLPKITKTLNVLYFVIPFLLYTSDNTNEPLTHS